MRLQARIEIDRPADEVFAYLSNFENNPVWQGGMERARFLTEPPLRVGSKYEQVARFMGRDIVSKFEITALEEGRRVDIATYESTFPIQVSRRVEPLGEARSLVTAQIDGEPMKGLLAVFNPLMGWFAQRSVTGDYARLKELLEAGA